MPVQKKEQAKEQPNQEEAKQLEDEPASKKRSLDEITQGDDKKA